ncbi:hypothetical protein ELQ92_12885 [Labedella populi]|uniref:DUF7882 domain-containing protein n=1 Tax=Labedella populi TaxID=2498850 RepID=A0A3S5CIY3_9MICO|nr:hypothetical protein [Labedella populi]RWZ59164.1 hypothetical protein ELQ92_12885 [Labedella populi]
MASLIYGTETFEFEDRQLAHVKFVISQKLRRQESFLLSWSYSLALGSGRSSIWLNEHSHLHFRFNGSKPPTLNQVWLERLMTASFSVRGLDLDECPEPQEQ